MWCALKQCMMKKQINCSQIHFTANIVLTLLVVGAAVVCARVWVLEVWLDGLVTVLMGVSGLYFAHRAVPRITGRLVDWICRWWGIT